MEFKNNEQDYEEVLPEEDEYEEEYESEERIIKKGVPSYELVYSSKLEEGETPLSKVVGHENQKKELLLVIDWFKRSKELKAKGISIPKGIILFGKPGNGKSLLIKEIIKCCEAPVFIFQGEQENVVAGIIETFKKAREAGHAIIVFDELDLLIDDDRRVTRALQENLDGVESNDDILVLAATNNLRSIPYPLKRNGRLEKLIEIPEPTGEEALELLKKHFKEFNIELPKDVDEEEIVLALNGINCAGVKTVVNDIVLRNGFENITAEMIDESISNVTEKVKAKVDKYHFEVAVHEAGHAVVARSFSEYFTINRINISGSEGALYTKEIDEDFWPEGKAIAAIKISMAGLLAEKIICGKWLDGSISDLENARHRAYVMYTISGYSSCWETLPPNGGRKETFIKRRRAERKIEALLRKCEKETTKYIKKHKEQILSLANLLYEKKHLKSSEILSCIG